jgi:RNA polymerase sigma factor (sigma-70 family)
VGGSAEVSGAILAIAMGDPDLAILDQWIAGDSNAGNALFKRYFTSLYRFFERKTEGDIDDLVQETFMACLKGRDTFKRQSTFRTYLFAVARNMLLVYWRKRATSQAIAIDEVSIASLSTSVGSRIAQNEERAWLMEALRALPLDQQLLLEMFYWQNLDRKQLAEVFEVETATIGSRLFRAREMLQARLVSTNAIAPRADDVLDAWVRSQSAELAADHGCPDR